jgi:predicted GIY-YIG superfamily endonuclease
MSKYANTVIYMITCKDEDIEPAYIGHTTNYESRQRVHKTRCINSNNAKHNFNVYKYIRSHGGWDNWEFHIIERYPCQTLKQANKREKYWYQKLGKNKALNMVEL